MKVVADTTPLSELAKVGLLSLLPELYREIIIPQEVYSELLAGNHPAAQIVPTAQWLKVISVSNRQYIFQLKAGTGLDLGESAAIILAEELNCDQLLIDERAARRVALSKNLPIIGTVGILIVAKQRGHLSGVKDALDNLITNGTRLSPVLYQHALMIAGEI